MANLDARNPQPSLEVNGNSTGEGISGNQTAAGSVARVFHSLILPELTRTSPDTGARSTTQSSHASVCPTDVETFFALLTHGEFSQATAFLDAAMARGADYELVLLELLAVAARKLGMDWERDECGFGDVTIGMSRLHQALQHLAMNAPFNPSQLQTRGRALLAPCPGEQHNFGVMMLDHCFHRAGWELRTIPCSTEGQLAKIASTSRFDVVGVSLSCDDQLPRLEKVVSTIRRESRNQNVIILVGGRVFAEDPSLGPKIGADAAPSSAGAALLAAEVLMDARRQSTLAQNVASG